MGKLIAEREQVYLFMRRSHTLLLRLYHDPRYDFDKVSVEYINRGAPKDRSIVGGKQIQGLRAGGMEIESDTGTTYIPYHRILRIFYDGLSVWERGTKKDSRLP